LFHQRRIHDFGLPSTETYLSPQQLKPWTSWLPITHAETQTDIKFLCFCF